MKKLLSFLIVTTVIVTNLFGQKNTLLVAGDIGFGIYCQDRKSVPTATINYISKNKYFAFKPTVGIQITKYWTVGLSININSRNLVSNTSYYNNPTFTTYFSTFDSETRTEITKGFGIGPMLRYSNKISNLFTLYGQLDLNFNTTKQKLIVERTPTLYNKTITKDSKNSLTSLNIFPAIFINLKNNFGLNLNFGGIEYEHSKNDDYSSKNFSMNFGKVLSIGISKNFNLSSSNKNKK